jgi:hypothetical protein
MQNTLKYKGVVHLLSIFKMDVVNGVIARQLHFNCDFLVVGLLYMRI